MREDRAARRLAARRAAFRPNGEPDLAARLDRSVRRFVVAAEAARLDGGAAKDVRLDAAVTIVPGRTHFDLYALSERS